MGGWSKGRVGLGGGGAWGREDGGIEGGKIVGGGRGRLWKWKGQKRRVSKYCAIWVKCMVVFLLFMTERGTKMKVFALFLMAY